MFDMCVIGEATIAGSFTLPKYIIRLNTVAIFTALKIIPFMLRPSALWSGLSPAIAIAPNEYTVILNAITSITDSAKPSAPSSASVIGNPINPQLLYAHVNAHTPLHPSGTPRGLARILEMYCIPVYAISPAMIIIILS